MEYGELTFYSASELRIERSNLDSSKGVYLDPIGNFSNVTLAQKIKKTADHLRKLCGAKDDLF